MGGKIDCYFDIASLYSYLAFAYLIENLETLEAHGVEVEFHPVLIGAINARSGNKPPWTVPAKATHGLVHELPRAAAHFHRPDIVFPKDMMARSHTVLPLRCLHHVKATHPRETYHSLIEALFAAFWRPPNHDLTDADVLVRVLARSGLDGDAVVAAAAECKDVLTAATGEALAKGAFGAPWLWVTNGEEGVGQPFFGSDRFHYVYKFLGLPYQDVKLLPPQGSSKSKL